MSATAESYCPSPNQPFSRNTERVLTAVIVEADAALDARALWRIQHATPDLATGRIRDAHDRVWLVPSTRNAGVIWEVALKTGQCRNHATGAACPDRAYNRKPTCCHVIAAQAAEINFTRDNQENRLLFPNRQRAQFEPPGFETEEFMSYPEPDRICARCGAWPLRCRCDERVPAPAPEREICPDCNGTTLDLAGNTGGTCPSCFGGYLR